MKVITNEEDSQSRDDVRGLSGGTLCSSGPTGGAVNECRAPSRAAVPLTEVQRLCLARPSVTKRRAGSICISKASRERGFQHGYLLAKEIRDSLHTTKAVWEYRSGMD